jgi:hypothetical protein
MEHVVFYPSAEGLPSFRRVSSLDEAVIFVEHLRNVEGITEFSMHELKPVPLAFRAYYRVETPSPYAQATVQVDGPADEVAAAPADEVVSSPADEVASSPADEVAAPIEAPDEDRSAEWVAEAEVVEPPAAAAPVAAAPVAAEPPAPEPAVAEPAVAAAPAPVAADAPAADAPAVEVPAVEAPAVEEIAPIPLAAAAPVRSTPFADAPPVTPAVMADFSRDAAPVVAPDILPEQDDAEATPVPAGRRSMGFFSR